MERKDFQYSHCLYYSCNALARVVTKMAEEEFAVTGLSPSHAFMMMSINEEHGICPRDLSQAMQLTPSTVTRLIEKLEQRGFVIRKVNGKFTEVYPTKEGIEINEKIKEAWLGLYQRTVDLVGEGATGKLALDIYEMKLKLEK